MTRRFDRRELDRPCCQCWRVRLTQLDKLEHYHHQDSTVFIAFRERTVLAALESNRAANLSDYVVSSTLMICMKG